MAEIKTGNPRPKVGSMSQETSTDTFETISHDADDLVRIRSAAETCLLILDGLPKTRWPDLHAEIEKAEGHLSAVLDAMNDSIDVMDPDE